MLPSPPPWPSPASGERPPFLAEERLRLPHSSGGSRGELPCRSAASSASLPPLLLPLLRDLLSLRGSLPFRASLSPRGSLSLRGPLALRGLLARLRRARLDPSRPSRPWGEPLLAGLPSGAASSGDFFSVLASFRRRRRFLLLLQLPFRPADSSLRLSDLPPSADLPSASSPSRSPPFPLSLCCFRFFFFLPREPSPSPSTLSAESSGALRRRFFPALRLRRLLRARFPWDSRSLSGPACSSGFPSSRWSCSSSSCGGSSSSGARLSAARFAFRRLPFRSLRLLGSAAASASLAKPSGGPLTPLGERRLGEELMAVAGRGGAAGQRTDPPPEPSPS